MARDLISLPEYNTVALVSYRLTQYFPGDLEQPEEPVDVEVLRSDIVSTDGDPDDINEYINSGRFDDDVYEKLRLLEGL